MRQYQKAAYPERTGILSVFRIQMAVVFKSMPDNPGDSSVFYIHDHIF